MSTEMTPSIATEEIARWLAYCERSAPGFMEVIQGASDDEIRSIEVACGRALPAEYAAFLKAMGNSDSESVHPLFNDFTFGIADTLLFYRDPLVPVQADALYVGTGGGDCEFYLDASVQDSRPYPVVSCGWYINDAGKYENRPPVRAKIADSWLAFLYREAFVRFRSRSLAYHLRLDEPASTLPRDEAHTERRAERFRLVAEQLGLVLVPHSGMEFRMYEKSDAAVLFLPAVLAGDSVRIHAESEREASRLAEIISDHTGMRL